MLKGTSDQLSDSVNGTWPILTYYSRVMLCGSRDTVYNFSVSVIFSKQINKFKPTLFIFWIVHSFQGPPLWGGGGYSPCLTVSHTGPPCGILNIPPPPPPPWREIPFSFSFFASLLYAIFVFLGNRNWTTVSQRTAKKSHVRKIILLFEKMSKIFRHIRGFS